MSLVANCPECGATSEALHDRDCPHYSPAYATLEQAPNTLTYRKRRHRWIKAKGLRAFWSTLRGIKSFTCACGANLHEHREGRLYSNFTGDYRQSILLTRKTPIPGCTRGGVR